MSNRILKWNVPVDDQEHLIGAGPVVHVACQLDASSVQVWTLEAYPPSAALLPPTKLATVVGTGHRFDGWLWRHAGSVLAGALVWHVLVREGRGSGE